MPRSTRTLGPLVLTSIVATSTAAPQGIRPHFGVGGGITAPTGDYHANAYGDGFNAGWQGMVLVEITRARWPIGLRLDATYGRNNGNDQLKGELTSQFGPTNQQTRLVGGNVDIIYAFPISAPVKPYLLTGTGLYNVKLSMCCGAGGDTSGTKVVWNAGGGARYDFRGAVLFVEARYCSVGTLLNATGRSYAGTFYRPGDVRVTQVGFTVGVQFGE